MYILDEIAEYLVNNPKAFIYYHDRGGWTIYPHKPRDVETGDFKLKPVYIGDDYANLNGYIPTLVQIMAKALKIRMYSI